MSFFSCELLSLDQPVGWEGCSVDSISSGNPPVRSVCPGAVSWEEWGDGDSIHWHGQDVLVWLTFAGASGRQACSQRPRNQLQTEVLAPFSSSYKTGGMPHILRDTSSWFICRFVDIKDINILLLIVNSDRLHSLNTLYYSSDVMGKFSLFPFLITLFHCAKIKKVSKYTRTQSKI